MVEMVKHLDYKSIRDSKDILNLSEYLTGIGASAGEVRTATFGSIMKLAQRQRGTQMYVEKEVSDDLELTDMPNLDPWSISYPGDLMEMYFEDPKLPTGLLYRGSFEALLRAAGPEVFEGFSAMLLAAAAREDAASEAVEAFARHRTFFMTEHKVDESLNGIVLLDLTPTLWAKMQTDPEKWDADKMDDLMGIAPNPIRTKLFGSEENARAEMDNRSDTDTSRATRQLFTMSLKSMVFASIPRYMVRQSNKKLPKKQGGKPGVNGRPRRPINRVIYLPEVRALKYQQAQENTNRSRQFYGRRGTLRTYRSERYTEKVRGTTKYVPPIPCPKGVTPPKTRYVVKEPNKK